MSVHQLSPELDPEEALERATSSLDDVIAVLTALIGPTGMAARVAGRVAAAARLNLTRPHP